MSILAKIPLGALARITGAAAAAYVGNATGDPNLAAALATAAGGYLANRTIALEEKHQQDLVASDNHHLQLVIAGAFRIALEELQANHAAHKAFFDSWQTLLDTALDHSTTLLAAIIPANFDPLLNAANPYVDPSVVAEEIQSLLRFWLAYQSTFQRSKNYPVVPPSVLPALPNDLRTSLEPELLPAFQRAFAHLLLLNDSAYARRAFARRHLQELVATSRENTAVLQRLDQARRLPLHPAAPIDENRELEILLARNRAIPVVGRQADLASLHDWLASPASVSIRILTGPAGAGKTRLSIELLDQLDPAQWHAGFLSEFDVGLNQCSWDRPTLAIVDYAASAVEPLKCWLAHVVDQTDYCKAPPLRVLMLEREADPSSGWLRLILDQTSTGRRIASRLDPPEPKRVTPIDDQELRRQILEATLRKIGVSAQLPSGPDPFFNRRLAQDLWRDPLYLMMAALVAGRPGAMPHALSLTRADLAFRLADRELDRIARFVPAGAAPEAAQLLTRLAALVTACRSLERADLVSIAREEGEALGIDFPGGPGVAANRITEALNRRDAPAAIEPDIIGEAVLLRAFGGQEVRAGSQALIRAAHRSDGQHARNVCSAITRTCQDFASDRCLEPVEWIEQIVAAASGSGDVGLLLALEEQMPADTLVLRERAARLDQLLLERFAALNKTGPSEETQSTCALLANNLSIRLGRLGRREEALAQAEEAVRIRRQLAQQRPDAFLPNLAMSLNNLANRLSDLGRREEALAQAEEAVRIYRQLAQQRPDAFLPDLAMSLNNLANRLSDLGRREEALAQAEEAVRIYRQLAQQRPDAFLPDLATSLNNLANMLSDLGRRRDTPKRPGRLNGKLRQSTVALTVADRQYAAVARPTRLSVAPDEARHSLLPTTLIAAMKRMFH